MKWISLDGKKDPLFDKKYMVLRDDGHWEPGYLKEIKHNAKGKEYVWNDVYSEEIQHYTTHYMEIELPKNNQS